MHSFRAHWTMERPASTGQRYLCPVQQNVCQCPLIGLLSNQKQICSSMMECGLAIASRAKMMVAVVVRNQKSDIMNASGLPPCELAIPSQGMHNMWLHHKPVWQYSFPLLPVKRLRQIQSKMAKNCEQC